MSPGATPANPAVPMLVPQGAHAGQRPMTLNRVFTLIGSAPQARLYLQSKSVSRCHAVVINTPAGLFVRDLASRTGTVVNGRPVREHDLREGDVVQVGTYTFRFTDPSRGKARTNAATAAQPAAALEIEGLDEPIELDARVLLIGRRETCDISLTENTASSAHAIVLLAGGRHVLRDLNSRTGTHVNGAAVHEHYLAPGDSVRVGETKMRYVALRRPVERGPDDAARTASIPLAVAEEEVSAERPGDAEAPRPVAAAATVEPQESSAEPDAPLEVALADDDESDRDDGAAAGAPAGPETQATANVPILTSTEETGAEHEASAEPFSEPEREHGREHDLDLDLDLDFPSDRKIEPVAATPVATAPQAASEETFDLAAPDGHAPEPRAGTRGELHKDEDKDEDPEPTLDEIVDALRQNLGEDGPPADGARAENDSGNVATDPSLQRYHSSADTVTAVPRSPAGGPASSPVPAPQRVSPPASPPPAQKPAAARPTAVPLPLPEPPPGLAKPPSQTGSPAAKRPPRPAKPRPVRPRDPLSLVADPVDLDDLPDWGTNPGNGGRKDGASAPPPSGPPREKHPPKA